MIDFEYLYKGVCGLTHAHQAGTMAGHLGAAVAAGYFFGEDQGNLSAAVFKGVAGELERIMAGEEAIWFNAKKAGVTPAGLFKAVPKEAAQPSEVKSIVDALRINISETRQSGHNVIFASLAIRALHDHGDFATPHVVEGVRKLTEGFHGAHAGRGYYGREKGWLNGNQVKLEADESFPAYGSIQEMVDTTISELIATASVKRQGFGGLWHIINHAAAITQLEHLGYSALAQEALPAHHQHIQLWRSLPDVESELGPVLKSEHDPREPEYWHGALKRDEARLTHRIKTLFGFYTLRPFIQDASTLRQADDAFLYLMA